MMTRRTPCLPFILAGLILFSCEPQPSSGNAVTASDYRFILLRHAEKQPEGGKNPGLTAKGRKRALRLVEILSKEKVTAIYTTGYRRTRQTVMPLARAQSLEPIKYKPRDSTILTGLFTQYPEGGLFVLVGHSNTIPALVNELTGEETYQNLNENEYGDLFVVYATAPGTGKVLRLNY